MTGSVDPNPAPPGGTADGAVSSRRVSGAPAPRTAAGAPSVTENQTSTVDSVWSRSADGTVSSRTVDDTVQWRTGDGAVPPSGLADTLDGVAHDKPDDTTAEAPVDGAEVADAPAAVDPTHAAAFFDVDNTLVHGASIYWFARGLAARRFFRNRDLARFAWQQARFRLRGKENHEHIADIKESALSFVAGRRVADIVALGEEIFAETIEARIWSGTRALAEAHLSAGQRVWLVTATPVELASIIARRLGFTGAIGTVGEVRDGRYTGRLVSDIMHGPAKAEAIRELAVLEGLDLAECTAYSDSSNDLPMLSAVGHAVAINPDAKLRRVARVNGWQVRDFRTGRKAIRVAVPYAVAAGAAAGALAGSAALRRRVRRRVG